MDNLGELLQAASEATAVVETPQAEIQPTETVSTDNSAVVEDAPQANDAPVSETVQTEATPASEATVTQTNEAPSWEELFAQKVGKPFTEYDAEYKELQQLKEKGTYKTSEGRLIDEVLSSGGSIETALLLSKVDSSTTTAEQALKIKLQLENPTTSAEQIQAYLNKEYGLGDFASEEEKLAGGFKLNKDGQAALKDLGEMRSKFATTPAAQNNGAQDVDKEAIVKSWVNEGKLKAVTDFKVEIPVPYKGLKDNQPTDLKETLSFQPSEADMKAISETMQTTIRNMGIKPDAEGLALAKQVAINQYKFANYDRDIAKAFQRGAALMTEQNAMRIHNSNPPKANGTTTFTTQTSEDDKRFEATMAGL